MRRFDNLDKIDRMHEKRRLAAQFTFQCPNYVHRGPAGSKELIKLTATQEAIVLRLIEHLGGKISPDLNASLLPRTPFLGANSVAWSSVAPASPTFTELHTAKDSSSAVNLSQDMNTGLASEDDSYDNSQPLGQDDTRLWNDASSTNHLTTGSLSSSILPDPHESLEKSPSSLQAHSNFISNLELEDLGLGFVNDFDLVDDSELSGSVIDNSTYSQTSVDYSSISDFEYQD